MTDNERIVHHFELLLSGIETSNDKNFVLKLLQHTNVIIKHSTLEETSKGDILDLLNGLQDILSKEEFYIAFQNHAISEIDKLIFELKEKSRVKADGDAGTVQRYDVFFSYSTEDKDIATELHRKLTATGLKCFLAEKDIRASEIWESRIRDALKDSNLVLLLITPRSVSSPWVLVEAGAAWGLNKKVLPLLMFVKPENLVDPIRKHQARIVETPAHIQTLVDELSSRELTISVSIT